MRALNKGTLDETFIIRQIADTIMMSQNLLPPMINGALWARKGAASSPLLGRNVESLQHQLFRSGQV